MKNIVRLKKEREIIDAMIKALETQYPIYCKSKKSNLVVKFTELEKGVVVVNNIIRNVGHESNNWIKHTDTDNWQQLEVSDNGFFDGKAVWCWDDDDTHYRFLRFWDAKNNCLYTNNGKRKSSYTFDNYAPFEGNYNDFMIEMFNTLER